MFYAPMQHKKGLEGELWGIANLLRFHEGSVETADIVQSYERRHASGPSTSQATAGAAAAAAPVGDATEAAAPAEGATGAAGPPSTAGAAAAGTSVAGAGTAAATAAAAAAANPGAPGGRGVKMEIVLLDENAYLPPAPAGDDDASDTDGEGVGRSRRSKKGSSGRGAGGAPGAAWDEDAGMGALVQELLQEEDMAGAAGTAAAGAAGMAGMAAAAARAAGPAGAGPAAVAALAGAAAAPAAAPQAAAADDGAIRSAATTQALTVSPATKQAAHDIIVISDDDDTVCSSRDDSGSDPHDEGGVVASAATPVTSPQQGAVSMLRARGVILHMQRHDMVGRTTCCLWRVLCCLSMCRCSQGARHWYDSSCCPVVKTVTWPCTMQRGGLAWAQLVCLHRLAFLFVPWATCIASVRALCSAVVVHYILPNVGPTPLRWSSL